MINPDAFSKAHYEGWLIPPIDGKYTLRIIENGIAYLYHEHFKLGLDAFSCYDTVAGNWRVAPGKYEIQVGAPSRD